MKHTILALTICLFTISSMAQQVIKIDDFSKKQQEMTTMISRLFLSAVTAMASMVPSLLGILPSTTPMGWYSHRADAGLWIAGLP